MGGWVWKSPFSRFKKIKKMLSKCIKMPKYSFKRNLFFAIWGGHWLSLAYPPHLTCITLATPRIVSATSRILLASPHIVSAAQEYDKKHLVNIKFKIFLSVSKCFLGWKNNFFQNCSKLPKNHIRTIKILFFFSRFSVIFFFEPFPNYNSNSCFDWNNTRGWG